MNKTVWPIMFEGDAKIYNDEANSVLNIALAAKVMPPPSPVSFCFSEMAAEPLG